MTLTKSQKTRRKQNVNTPHVQGHGDYYTDTIKPFLAKNVPKGTFRRLGGAAGAGVGAYTKIPGASAIGGAGGGMLGNALSRILGFGDYEVRSNTVSKVGKAVSAGELVPDFGVKGNATRVRHREFIADIVVPGVPTAFNVASYSINAGNALLFPWLSSVAAQYQQYRFEGLVFEFKSLSSDITAGGPLGSVILATNYDVLEAPYLDKVHMENAQYSVSAKPSMSQFHSVECDPEETGQNWFYVRDSSSSLAASNDARFADLGKFQIATAGLPGAPGTVLGELWASYDIVLLKPELVNINSIGTRILGAGTVTRTAPFGTNPVIAGDTRVNVGPNYLIAMTTGSSLILVVLVGTTIVTPTIAASTVGSALLLEQVVNGTGTAGLFVFRADVTAIGQTFVLDTSGSATISASVTRIASWAFALG